MKFQNSESQSIHNLRARAEQSLNQSQADEVRDRDPVVYELRLHELELRMQNEALRELQVELALARERYRDLFAHAPVAYLVLDRESRVLEANVAACHLLHLDREHLLGRKLSAFIDPQQTEQFTHHLRATLSGSEPQRDELSLIVPNLGSREVRLESVRDH